MKKANPINNVGADDSVCPRNKGITLIALIITILILLILVTVSISILSNTGIIEKVKQATIENKIAEIQEKIQLEYAEEKITNLKVTSNALATRIRNLSENKYPEITEISPATTKVYYTLTLTGKEYEINTETGELKEYVDELAKVVPTDASLWTKTKTTSGYKITGYTGTGDQLKDVVVPNVFIEDGVEIPVTEVSLQNIAFEGTITIPSNITLAQQSFNSCTGITSLNVGNNVTIPGNSFVDCTSLKEITIGNDVLVLTGVWSQGTFSNCINLENVIIGINARFSGNWSDDYLSHHAFYNCKSLANVTVGSISETTNNTFMNVGQALQGDIIINEGVETIKIRAFKGCTNITSVTIPNSVTSIEANVFNGCTSLTNIYVDMTEDEFNNITKDATWNSGVNATITYKE